MSKKVNKRDYYKITGETITRTKRACPKCGAGVFLGEHADRFVCGKCHYTEFKVKAS